MCGHAGLDWEAEEAADRDSGAAEQDGMEGLVALQKKQRFGPDLRLMEAC